jgi:hypothetical protein
MDIIVPLRSPALRYSILLRTAIEFTELLSREESIFPCPLLPFSLFWSRAGDRFNEPVYQSPDEFATPLELPFVYLSLPSSG